MKIPTNQEVRETYVMGHSDEDGFITGRDVEVATQKFEAWLKQVKAVYLLDIATGMEMTDAPAVRSSGTPTRSTPVASAVWAPSCCRRPRMPEPYTPSFDQLKSAYVESRRHQTSYQFSLAVHVAEFDRCIREHDAKVLHAATDAIHVHLREDSLATYDVGTMAAYRALIRVRADRILNGVNPDG